MALSTLSSPCVSRVASSAAMLPCTRLRLHSRHQSFSTVHSPWRTPRTSIRRVLARHNERSAVPDRLAEDSGLPRSGAQLACLTAMLVAGLQDPASAEELVKYNAAGGGEFLSNAAGAA